VILNDGGDEAVEFAEVEIPVSIPIKKPAKLSAGGVFTSKNHYMDADRQWCR
jgi:hypothetical protein